MGIHNFRSDYSVPLTNPVVAPSGLPAGLSEMPAGSQLSHATNRNPFDGNDFLAYSSHLEEFLTPAFRALDDTMKQYWTGIRVPTKDSYRFMRVKIAGGDKSLLIWADELKEGRVRMPVASLSRESHEYNSEKHSPRFHAMSYRNLSTRGDKVAKVFRPVPYLVDYKMSIWTETKRDAENILYQVLTRFNPLAEFRMFDGHLAGNVVLQFKGATDASDKEIGYDQYANVRYEIQMTADAWLPLPEQIVKTVLGHATSLVETTGSIMQMQRYS